MLKKVLLILVISAVFLINFAAALDIGKTVQHNYTQGYNDGIHVCVKAYTDGAMGR